MEKPIRVSSEERKTFLSGTVKFRITMNLTNCVRLLPFIIYFKTINSSHELHANCSLLVLDTVTYSRRNDFIYAIWDPDVDAIITSIAARSNRTVVLSKQSLFRTNDINYGMLPAVYLLYSTNFASFQSIFSSSRAAQSSWFPRGVFVVFLQYMQTNYSVSDLNVIANLLYSANVYNFIILTTSENDSGIVDMYKWDPFAETSRCGAVLNVNKVNACDGTKMLTPGNNLFSINFSVTFPKGCIINAAAFHWPPYTYASPPDTNNFIDGLNIRMMQALTRRYGMKVKYIAIDHRVRWGVFLKTTNTWTGVMGAVHKGKADIGLGQILQTPLRFKFFDYSYTGPLFMKFHLAMPGQLPHWKSMIRVFPLSIWTIIFAVYMITCIFIWIISCTTQDSENEFFKGCGNCFLSLWRIALTTPTNIEPISRKVRLVFVPWLIYSFHITLVYSSALLGVITTPIMEEPSIRTLQQFTSSEFGLLVVPQFLQISSMMDDEFKSIIAVKRKGDLKITDAREIEQMILKKNFAIVDPQEHFEIVAQEKLEYIYTLDDFVRLNQGLCLRKGSIYSKYVRDVQNLLFENGIFFKWRRDLVGGYKYKKHRKVKYRNDVLPLTIEELSGSFYVLLFGLSVALVCFCFELMYFYFEKVKKL